MAQRPGSPRPTTWSAWQRTRVPGSAPPPSSQASAAGHETSAVGGRAAGGPAPAGTTGGGGTAAGAPGGEVPGAGVNDGVGLYGGGVGARSSPVYGPAARSRIDRPASIDGAQPWRCAITPR